MKADITTKVSVQAARRLAEVRRKVRERIPYGPMQVQESPDEVAQREMSGRPLTLEELAKKLGIRSR